MINSKWGCLGLAETEFKVFAHKLATYFQGDDSPEKFTRTLFVKIYLNPNGDSLLDDMETRMLRGYFYGEQDNLVDKGWSRDKIFEKIELYENGGELFGWSWAKKATREKQIATETDVIEQL